MSNFNAMHSKVQSACKGCTERTQGCHSTCEKYMEFRENLAADRALYVADEAAKYTRTADAERRARYLRSRKSQGKC